MRVCGLTAMWIKYRTLSNEYKRDRKGAEGPSKAATHFSGPSGVQLSSDGVSQSRCRLCEPRDRANCKKFHFSAAVAFPSVLPCIGCWMDILARSFNLSDTACLRLDLLADPVTPSPSTTPVRSPRTHVALSYENDQCAGLLECVAFSIAMQ